MRLTLNGTTIFDASDTEIRLRGVW
jgi:hypothetical protein